MDEESQQQQGVTSEETPATPGGESNSQVSKEEYDRIVNDYENVKKALQDERNGKKKQESEDDSSAGTDEEEEKKRIQQHLRDEYLKETVEAKTEGTDKDTGNRVQRTAQAILAVDLPEGYDRKTIQSAVDRALRAENVHAQTEGSQTATPSDNTQQPAVEAQPSGTGATEVAAATSGSAPSTSSAGESTPSKVEVSQQTAQELRAKGLNVEEHQQRLERFYERSQYDQIRMHGGIIKN